MKFDPDANHAMWTRVNDDVFKRFILQAKEENIYVDSSGRVDIGSVVNLLVNTFADGRYVVLPDKPIQKDPPKKAKPKPKKEEDVSPVVETSES